MRSQLSEQQIANYRTNGFLVVEELYFGRVPATRAVRSASSVMRSCRYQRPTFSACRGEARPTPPKPWRPPGHPQPILRSRRSSRCHLPARAQAIDRSESPSPRAGCPRRSPHSESHGPRRMLSRPSRVDRTSHCPRLGAARPRGAAPRAASYLAARGRRRDRMEGCTPTMARLITAAAHIAAATPAPTSDDGRFWAASRGGTDRRATYAYRSTLISAPIHSRYGFRCEADPGGMRPAGGCGRRHVPRCRSGLRQPREPLGGHIVRRWVSVGPLQQEQAEHRVVEVIVAGHPVDRSSGRLRPRGLHRRQVGRIGIQCRHVSIEWPRIGVLEIAPDLVGRPALDRLAEQAARTPAQPGAKHAIAEPRPMWAGRSRATGPLDLLGASSTSAKGQSVRACWLPAVRGAQGGARRPARGVVQRLRRGGLQGSDLEARLAPLRQLVPQKVAKITRVVHRPHPTSRRSCQQRRELVSPSRRPRSAPRRAAAR